MADIFKLIRTNVERSKPKNTDDEKSTSNNKSRLDLDNFIIGEEEKRNVNKKKRTSKEDVLDFEIGSEPEKKNYSQNIDKIDFIELNKMSDKKQNKLLKKEYLNLLDKIEEISSEIDSLGKKSNNSSVKLHQIKKENFKMKESIRLIGGLLPEGTDLKNILDTSGWNINEIEDMLIEKVKFVIDRAKNADEYVEERLKETQKDIKQFKKKCIQLETTKSKLEEQISDLKSEIKDLKELGYVEKKEKPKTNEESEELKEQQREIEEMERKLLEKKRLTEQRKNDALNTSEEINHNHDVNTEQKQPNTEQEEANEQTTQQNPSNEIDEEEAIDNYKPTFDDEEDSNEQDEENDKIDDSEIDTHLLLDVEKHIGILPDARKYIIEIIGKTGISRNQELRAFLEEDEKGCSHFKKGTKFSYQEMSAATKGLKDSGYLSSDKVNLGSKGGYNFQVFELSDMGKAIYKVVTKKNPIVPEKKTLVDQHKSLEHGYLIKDCATEFELMGYKVFTERKDLRFDLPNGKRKDFDLIVEKDGEKLHIEVERGTHTDEDFFKAMNKIYQVMNKINIQPARFYFVAPNEQALFGKTKRQFFLWIKQEMGGVSAVKGKIIVNFATFDKIKKNSKNIWEEIKL